MDRQPAVAVAFEKVAVTKLSTVTVTASSIVAAAAVVGKSGAVGTKECYYPWDCYTWDRPDSTHGQWGTFESENEPERMRVGTLTEPKNYYNQKRPAMKVAYDGEVTMQSDRLNTVGIVFAPLVGAVGTRALLDRTRRCQCCYQIHSTDYN